MMALFSIRIPGVGELPSPNATLNLRAATASWMIGLKVCCSMALHNNLSYDMNS